MYEELNKLTVLDLLKLARCSLQLSDWSDTNLSISLLPTTLSFLESKCRSESGFREVFVQNAYFKPSFTCIVFGFKWYIDELVEQHNKCVRYVFMNLCKNPRSGHAIRYIRSKYEIKVNDLNIGFIIACRFNQLDNIQALSDAVDQKVVSIGFKILCMNKLGHIFGYSQALKKDMHLPMPKSPDEEDKKMMRFVMKSNYGKKFTRFKLDDLVAQNYFVKYMLPTNLRWIERVYINCEHIPACKIRDGLRIPTWYFDRSYCTEKYAKAALWVLSKYKDWLEPYSAQCILYCVVYQSRTILKKLLSVYPDVFEKSVLSNSMLQLAYKYSSTAFLDLFDQRHTSIETLDTAKQFE